MHGHHLTHGLEQQKVQQLAEAFRKHMEESKNKLTKPSAAASGAGTSSSVNVSCIMHISGGPIVFPGI